MIKILLADDHRVVREGLKNLLEKTKDFAVVAQAADGAEVLAVASKVPLDAVVLDISMPGPSGIDTLKQLKHRFPKLPVLVLSQHPGEHYAVRALRAGAAGYLTKESDPTDLVTAIRKITTGGHYVDPEVAERIAVSLDPLHEKPRHERLSDREYEILCAIGAGKTVSGIARDLSLSVKTISTYRARILEKMRMSTTAELIRYVIQMGLSPVRQSPTS